MLSFILLALFWIVPLSALMGFVNSLASHRHRLLSRDWWLQRREGNGWRLGHFVRGWLSHFCYNEIHWIAPTRKPTVAVTEMVIRG